MPIYCRGRSFTIEEVDGAEESRQESYGQVPGSKAACIGQLRALKERFADLGRLNSPEQFRHEEDGIFAIKARCGLRAYGWFSRRKRRVFVISHYTMKKRDKMLPQDLDRAKRNRELYENAED